MTEKEKAIEWLTACKETNYRHSPTIQDYMDMAISALSESKHFDGMTNGEVIETLFPNCIDYKGYVEVKTTLDYGKLFRRSWWDSPYKKGGE